MFNRGHAVKNGKFYSFSPDGIVVVRPWGPGAAGWLFTPERGWKGFAPGFNIDSMRRKVHEAKKNPQSKFQVHEANALQFLLDSWPKEAQREARRFSGDHWCILQLMNRFGDPAFKCLREHPILGFLLAQGKGFPGAEKRLADRRTIRRLLTSKRRQIVAQFGFPETEGAVRVVEKIPSESVSRRRLFSVRRTLGESTKQKRALLHLPRLNGGVIAIVTNWLLFPCVTSDMLSQVAVNPMDDRFGRSAHRLDKVLAQLQEKMPLIRSVGQLDALYEEIVVGPRRERGPKGGEFSGVFPCPPLAAPPSMEALTAPVDLVEEGRAMAHCAGSLIEAVAMGRAYLYRLLSPERGTVLLKRSDFDGVWGLSEARGYQNVSLQPETVEVIREWLEQCSQSEQDEEESLIVPSR